jgi:hypothetical protein
MTTIYCLKAVYAPRSFSWSRPMNGCLRNPGVGGGGRAGAGVWGGGWDLVHQPRQLPPLNHHKSSPYIYSIYNFKKWNLQFFLPELHSSLGAKRWNVYKFNCITCTHICTLSQGGKDIGIQTMCFYAHRILYTYLKSADDGHNYMTVI